ncbi:MAG TPA: response regulator [Planctomycetota bacterium]|nr:response regulator [Planctomycetota bacterium]
MPQNSTILIIEDDPAAAESIETLCREMGHRTLVAYDGMTGLQMAANEIPKLILSDIAMPGMDGFEVARRVRSNHDLDHTAIVAVTGHPPKTPAANQKTFDDYVIKPFSVENITSVIAKYCDRESART